MINWLQSRCVMEPTESTAFLRHTLLHLREKFPVQQAVQQQQKQQQQQLVLCMQGQKDRWPVFSFGTKVYLWTFALPAS